MKKKTIAILLCAAFAATVFAGCNSQANVSSATALSDGSSETESSQSESSSESSMASSSSQLESSQDGSSEKPGTSDSSLSDEEKYNFLPEVQKGDSSFKTQFGENVLDEEYNNEIMFAASNSKLMEIISTASSGWINAIDTAYAQALDSCETDEEKEELKAGQADWSEGKDSKIQSIRDESLDNIEAEYEIMYYYRDRAAELLYVVYENTGSFVLPTGEAGGAG